MSKQQDPNVCAEWSRWPHFFSAILLMLFALSHFAYVWMGMASGDAENPVFPFLTDQTIVLLAGCFEFCASLLCFGYRGHELPNYTILFFIATMCWYRWAFSYNGGTDCHCTGILGRMLHLSKPVEKAAPITVLVLLGISTLPWFWSAFRKLQSARVQILLFSLLIASTPAWAQESFHIKGEYETVRMDLDRKEPIKATEQRFCFSVILSSNCWQISVTNTLDRTKWEQLIYDGKDLYNLTEYKYHFGGVQPSENTVFTSISHSPVYNPAIYSFLDAYVPWFAFGLSPKMIESAPQQSVPLPWYVARLDPKAFGWKWTITPSPDGRLVSECKIVRDKSLDMKTEDQEFCRPEMDPPDTLADRRDYHSSLVFRKALRNGFVCATFTCTNWLQTNGFSIPMSAQFLTFPNSPKYSEIPGFRALVTTTNVSVIQEAPKSVAVPAAPVQIHDYRYKVSADKRIFSYAEYALGPGDSWKPDNDPLLLAKAQEWLKHGRRWDDFSMRKSYVAWLAFAGFVALPIAAMLISKKRSSKKMEPKGLGV